MQALVEELERQKPLKWDEKVSSSDLQTNSDNGQIRLRMEGKQPFSITRPCHSQIAERLEIPAKYYHRMKNEAPELLAENVNTWLRRTEKHIFIRGLGPNIRAVLSDRYRASTTTMCFTAY